MPRETNIRLVQAPPHKPNPSTQTGWSYIVERLIDRPGQTYPTLAYDRPQHLSEHSIQVLCYDMAKTGILIREGVGTEALFRVAPNGLDKISERRRQEGMPGAGQGERGAADRSKGFAQVAQLPPDQRPPLSPVKGKPVELPDDIVKTPSGKFLTVREPSASPAPGPNQQALKAAEDTYTEPCLILIVGDKPRRFPTSVAKSLYRQLKEFFE